MWESLLMLCLGCIGVAYGTRISIQWDTPAPLCGSVLNLKELHLECPTGATISNITFASYGTPGGNCGAQWIGKCHAQNSTSVVESLCLGHHACTIAANGSNFGDPCFKTVKYLKVDYLCKEKTGSISPRTVHTVPTYQIVPNPELRRGRKMYDASFRLVEDLNATMVRVAPWIPYPLLMVPELMPPTPTQTYWNFTYMDPMIQDAMHSIQYTHSGKPKLNRLPVLCLCDGPGWMWKGGGTLNINTTNPDKRSTIPNEHGNGELVDPTGKEYGEYFRRIAEYYVKGQFKDELGNVHVNPGPTIPLQYWEVMNEVNAVIKKEVYTVIYDATVEEIRSVVPDMKFVGIALEQDDLSVMEDWFTYFLNSSNHKPAALPLQWVSFHYYSRWPSGDWNALFKTVDTEVETIVRMALETRDALAPQVKYNMNEVGCMGSPLNDLYWSACGAWWAYMFASVGKLGVDAIGTSQLVGYPAMDGFSAEFPDVTMVDYKTPRPNARAWVLKLLIDMFGSDLSADPYPIYFTDNDGPDVVFAQGYRSHIVGRAVLLVNRVNEVSTITLKGATGRVMSYTDVETAYEPYRNRTLPSDTIQLQPFTVGVIVY